MASYSRILLSAAAVALLPMAAHANLIDNGTFAAPSCASPTFCTYHPGDTNITGWSISGDSVDLITGYWQAPPGGGNSVDLDGNGQGAVASSSFATTNGGEYTLSFELSGNPDGTLGPHTVQVDVDGTIQDFTYNTATEQNSHGNMKWLAESMTFTANTALSSLTFTSLDSAGSTYGPVIGDVDVEVPEPGTMALLGAGLLGIGFFGRRKSSKTV
jgi:choice-of-anchor C domain-containing protein